MMRKCNLCAYKAPEGCIAWECEYINRIEAIDAYKATRWIPVTEQLPETTGAFLVSCQNGNVKVGHFTTFNNTWTDARAVAWMKMPEPYEEV